MLVRLALYADTHTQFSLLPLAVLSNTHKQQQQHCACDLCELLKGFSGWLALCLTGKWLLSETVSSRLARVSLCTGSEMTRESGCLAGLCAASQTECALLITTTTTIICTDLLCSTMQYNTSSHLAEQYATLHLLPPPLASKLAELASEWQSCARATLNSSS